MDEDSVELPKSKQGEGREKVRSDLVTKLWKDKGFKVSMFKETIKGVWNPTEGAGD